MLLSLHIENMAVIKTLDVDFSRGFTVVTGETGAGKSVMIESLRLLMGGKAEKDIIRHGEGYAEVSALFSELAPSVLEELAEMDIRPDEDGYLTMLRRVSDDGKSTARINGRTVSLSSLREGMQLLLHIHGQNDTAFLKRKGGELAILDAAAHNDAELASYRESYRELLDVKRQIERLKMDEGEKNREMEMLRYQISDIEEVSVEEGEEERLFDEKLKLRNVEKIAKQTSFAYRALRSADKGNACYIIDRTASALRAIEGVVPEAAELAARLDECYSEIEDIAERAKGLTDFDGEDPTRALDKVETRLAEIARITRKYGGSEKATLDFLKSAKDRLCTLESMDEDRSELVKQYERIYKTTEERASALQKTRVAAAESLRSEVASMLHALDMPNALFTAEFSLKKEKDRYLFDENGYAAVEFLIVINKGEPPVPVAKCASGGESSRIMLALKSVIAKHDGMPTVVFDEIDSGVSGKTSRKIGFALKETARSSQILCITHSAQIASLADTHLLVSKGERDGRTHSQLRVLNTEERVEELARILGGIHVTESQRDAARDMLLRPELA